MDGEDERIPQALTENTKNQVVSERKTKKNNKTQQKKKSDRAKLEIIFPPAL